MPFSDAEKSQCLLLLVQVTLTQAPATVVLIQLKRVESLYVVAADEIHTQLSDYYHEIHTQLSDYYPHAAIGVLKIVTRQISAVKFGIST